MNVYQFNNKIVYAKGPLGCYCKLKGRKIAVME